MDSAIPNVHHCYVFVDKYGDGIQAVVHGNKDQKYVESIIQLGNCYEIDRYACVEPAKYINALPHEVNMRIGSASSITPLDDIPEIPHHYFNFGNYQTLIDICDNRDETTATKKLSCNTILNNQADYYGRLQGRIEAKSKKDGSPLIVFTLIDTRNEPVQVILWKEIATDNNRFDKEAIEKEKEPVIIAVTAMRVVSFLGKPQLQSTTNTFVFLNPPIPGTENLLSRFFIGCFKSIWKLFEGCLDMCRY